MLKSWAWLVSKKDKHSTFNWGGVGEDEGAESRARLDNERRLVLGRIDAPLQTSARFLNL